MTDTLPNPTGAGFYGWVSNGASRQEYVVNPAASSSIPLGTFMALLDYTGQGAAPHSTPPEVDVATLATVNLALGVLVAGQNLAGSTAVRPGQVASVVTGGVCQVLADATTVAGQPLIASPSVAGAVRTIASPTTRTLGVCLQSVTISSGTALVWAYIAAGTEGGQSGAQGPQGPQGYQGAFGGPQGNQGNQGAQGAQGSQGAGGTAGTHGAQGPQGSNGAQGPQGYQGANGSGGGGAVLSLSYNGLGPVDCEVLDGLSYDPLVGGNVYIVMPNSIASSINSNGDTPAVVTIDGTGTIQLVVTFVTGYLGVWGPTGNMFPIGIPYMVLGVTNGDPGDTWGGSPSQQASIAVDVKNQGVWLCEVPAALPGQHAVWTFMPASAPAYANQVVTGPPNSATLNPGQDRVSNVVNPSADPIVITMQTGGPPLDGDTITARIYDATNAAQTITWFNIENSTKTAPTMTNGSTTHPLEVTFRYNAVTSLWRTIDVA